MMEIKLFRSDHDVGDPATIEVWETYSPIAHEVGDCLDGISPEDLYELYVKWNPDPDCKLTRLSAHEFFIGIAKLLEAGFLRVEVRED